ncbi:hypothetical protein, partial [Nonomuraea sp. NPDC049709]|uniref:hypothetical protein n=1 Tax=Nonomuraea sp. NPDC049709 TaxID=3154736 RepID=UPI00342B3F46
MMSTEGLRAALRGTAHWAWLDGALVAAAEQPGTVGRAFAAAGRRTGRAPLPDAPGWTADEAARTLL